MGTSEPDRLGTHQHHVEDQHADFLPTPRSCHGHGRLAARWRRHLVRELDEQRVDGPIPRRAILRRVGAARIRAGEGVQHVH